MPRPFTRFKVLLDEGFISKQSIKTVNSRHDVKHIKLDYGKEGLEDEKVYRRALKEGRLIVVFNVKDFKRLVLPSHNCGVIGVSRNLKDEEIDKKLLSLLNKSKKKDLYGKYTSITKSGMRTKVVLN